MAAHPGSTVDLVQALGPDDFRHLVTALFSHARRLGAPPQEAEDAVAEALMVPLADPGWYDPSRGSLKAALRAVVTHRYLDRIRHLQRRGRWVEHHRPTWDVQPTAPAQAIGARQAAEHRARFLERLTSEERAVFAMWIRQSEREVDGPAAAAALDLSYREFEAAKKRLRRTCARILDELGLCAEDLWTLETA